MQRSNIERSTEMAFGRRKGKPAGRITDGSHGNKRSKGKLSDPRSGLYSRLHPDCAYIVVPMPKKDTAITRAEYERGEEP